ncbi:alkaline phosphatase PhoX [Rhodoferax saidenbachensis]|uniref:Secreted PhoX family phosphatase n=1 Tax=Rhodoferax saidenbachensis TaxID=1484693 RepID=A0ABU1ZLS3_9BURK|nr:alkaline phosphatase PhoX [Rhodoferax saidenbachensis]MDR7306492.1 secreted PhoX family phosphatase [Rhodoferax saidenbachensis]
MSHTPLTTRRSALKFLATAPMLPLGALASSSLLGGCATTSAAGSSAPFASAAFSAMAAPSLANPAAMATTTVASSLQVTLQDGSTRAYKLAYEPFFITGDRVPDGNGGTMLAGGYVDILNKPIIDTSVPGKERQFFSDCPDGTSLLQLPTTTVKGIKGKAVFAVVQFEYTNADQSGADAYGTLPSPIAVLTLDQDPATGKLTLVKYHNVDTSQAQGLWITCGSSLSPWGTHLSSEEYEPDAFFVAENKVFKSFSKNLFGEESIANPYHYGHQPEVTVNPDGTGTLVKHYCMGRLSHELIQVMPDNRTALMGNDATNSGLFMFVADKEKTLSAGTLYVAKLGEGFSIDPAAPGTKLSWIKLGHATSDEIEKLANKLKPTDIMDVRKTDPNDASFTKIFYNGAANWVKVKPGMEKAAAFLETQRYAYLMGGSMGFTKMEGTTVNIKDKIAYSALQNIQDSMVKTGKGWNAASGIALDKPLIAGGVMAHTLSAGQNDQTGAAIKSDWVPSLTRALLVGEDIAPDALGNRANPDLVSNPDNLKFSEKLRTLFIGEDSSTHVNNFVWAYNVDTKQLSRLMSMPSGAEATGLGVVDDLNGWTYITTNFQHPGDWLPALHGKVQATLDPLVRANYKNRFGAAVGYLTGAPVAIKLG